jgi:hypothetical protein
MGESMKAWRVLCLSFLLLSGCLVTFKELARQRAAQGPAGQVVEHQRLGER